MPETTDTSLARDFRSLFETYHGVTYYTSEIIDWFKERGMRGWWMSYFAYRAAPFGPVPAEVVIATFYNFAPRMIRRAVPAVWDVMPPAEILAIRLDAVDRGLRRILRDRIDDPDLTEAAALARRAIEGSDVAGRPLYAAHAALPWPDEPHLILWHACTLLREHRFDGHSIALAAAGVDGAASHVLMAARGHGNRPTILGIRGWTEEEWEAAEQGLIDRGWIARDGSFTESGRSARQDVEAMTDRLAQAPIDRIGAGEVRRLMGLLDPFVRLLKEEGGIPGEWPPPHLLKPLE